MGPMHSRCFSEFCKSVLEIDIVKYIQVSGDCGITVQKGVHFDSTYASTPRQNSTRLRMVIMVRFKMRRLAFDISMAYRNVEPPESQKIAIRYPNGLQRFKTIDGIRHELFMVLIKICMVIQLREGTGKRQETRD